MGSFNLRDWQLRWNIALRQQHEMLFDEKKQTIKPRFAEFCRCPVCDSNQSDPYYEKDGFTYVLCKDCSMIFMNPRLNLAATHAFYNSNVNAIYNEIKFDTETKSTRIDNATNRKNFKLIDDSIKVSSANVLEIGCAKGIFLQEAKTKGYNVYGLELNEKNYVIAKELLGDTIFKKDLLDINFESEMFDVIYMRDVIEHIPNPRSFLTEINRIAKPGALLFVETHNIDGLIHQIVREKHTVIFGFEHPNHWSPSTLEKALNNYNFYIQNIYFESLDFNIGDLLGYYIEPTFTTIYPWSIGEINKIILKCIRLPFLIPPLRWLDRCILPTIANITKRGSVMKVIAIKK